MRCHSLTIDAVLCVHSYADQMYQVLVQDEETVTSEDHGYIATEKRTELLSVCLQVAFPLQLCLSVFFVAAECVLLLFDRKMSFVWQKGHASGRALAWEASQITGS